MLTEQDIRNLQAFLNRVDMKGAESMAMTEIQIKLSNMGAKMQEPVDTEPPVEPPTPDAGTGEPEH